MRMTLAILCAAFAAVGAAQDIDIDTAAVTTNLVIVSAETNVLGLTRQALLNGGDGRVVDRSGTVVSYADAVAQKTVATNIQRIASATAQGITNALSALWNITNQIPSHAEHVALYLPRATPADNLAGEVVDEGTNGTTDWQTVRYSQYLALAPHRQVNYTYLGTTATVECVWDTWNPSSLVHRCSFPRPAAFRGVLINSRRHDTMGGAKGFDFGSALVTVDGKATFTGPVTNALTGDVWEFRNGVRITNSKEMAE